MPASPDVVLRAAEPADVGAITALVDAAYGGYIERIGQPPGPMTENYADVVEHSNVTVVDDGVAIVGVIVLSVTDEGFLVENVAVHPTRHGRGLGRQLLLFAEAQATGAGFDSLYLYTHEKMTENLALYARAGYVEFDRRPQNGFDLVYLRKTLEATQRQANLFREGHLP